jgi:hypothetical protein
MRATMKLTEQPINPIRKTVLGAGLIMALLIGASCLPESHPDRSPLLAKKNSAARKNDCSDWSKDLPPACHSQEDCLKGHGHGWFCSEQDRVTDACGEEHVWPRCKPIR